MRLKMRYGHCVNCGAILESYKCKYCDTLYERAEDSSLVEIKEVCFEEKRYNELKQNEILCNLDYKGDIDIDLFAIMLDEEGCIRNIEDIVFYNNRIQPGVSVDCWNNLKINFNKLKGYVSKIVVGCFIYEQKYKNFGMADGYFSVFNGNDSGREICRFGLDEFAINNIITAVEFSHDEYYNWKITLSGQGCVCLDFNEYLNQTYAIRV